MTIKDVNEINIEEFAKNFAEQSKSLLPDDLTQYQRDYVINKVQDFCLLSGNALNHDEDLDFTKADVLVIVQLIGKWTFHKNIDLIRAKLPEKYWEPVLQQVAFSVFEAGKKVISDKLEKDKALSMIEVIVKNSYEKSLTALAKNGIIDEKDRSKIEDISHLDKFIKIKSSIKKNYRQLLRKILVLITSFIVAAMIFLAVYIFSLFVTDGIPFVTKHIIPIFLILLLIVAGPKGLSILVKRDINKKLKKLAQVKQQMKDLVDPNNMYCRLGTDILGMQLGSDLLKIADPKQEGQLLAKIAALRQRLTDELGYIIPIIRIQDSTELNSKEYSISIRNIKVAQGTVYPDRVMLIADEAKKKNFSIPKDAVVGVDPLYKSLVYWIKLEQVDKSISLTLIDPSDVMVAHIRQCVIKYADEIITLNNIAKLVEYAKTQSPACIECLTPKLISLVDLQKIIINLIKERVSIKDIVYIFEKLSDYANFSKDPDILSEKLRFSLRKHICKDCASKDKILYTVTLPDNLEKELTDLCRMTEYGKKNILSLDKQKDLIEYIKSSFNKTTEVTDNQPVILCSPEIRLALFKLLNSYFIEITVLSNKEIVDDFKIKTI